MTDTEKIIKGIKICGDDKSSCKDCPYYELKSPMCLATLHEDVTNLIKRQQEEINHFAKVNKMVVDLKTVKNDDEEILRLLVNQSVKFIPKNDDIKAIQRDAVVNFAEKMKARFAKLEYKTDTHKKTCSINQLDATVNWVISEVTSMEIDKLVNEMFPEQKGEKNE